MLLLLLLLLLQIPFEWDTILYYLVKPYKALLGSVAIAVAVAVAVVAAVVVVVINEY